MKLSPLHGYPGFTCIASYSKEHFVSNSVVGKPDGIQTAWRNNFCSLSGPLVPKHLIISFPHLFAFITTSQTSYNKPVAAAVLSPFISCQFSGLQGEQTRTGSYNRTFGGERTGGGGGGGGNVCVYVHKRAALKMIHGSHPMRGAHSH